ncbi:MAG: hypothetical protein KatS3mg092_0511 [Patescibacteria group bacterium]|nr:MAG: hypothetical protein KatS3mg092_0511 [Patescibacteria group bacterium]
MREFITGYDTKDYSFFTGAKEILNDKAINFLSASNVRYLLDYTNNSNIFVRKWTKANLIKEVYKDSDITIYEIIKYKPRFYFPDKVIKTTKNQLEIMRKKEFDPNKTIVINSDKEKILDQTMNCLRKTNILEYTGDIIKMDIKNNCGESYLFIANTYFPGWVAYLNGKKILIEKANFSFQAIKIPQGEFSLKLVYFPQSFKYGLFLSFISFFILILTVLLGKL